MVVIASTRALPLLLLATCAAFAQQAGKQALPDAPSIHAIPTNHNALKAKARSSMPAVSMLREPLVLHFDPGHFDARPIGSRPGTYSSGNLELAKASNGYRASDSDNLFTRAFWAASSTFITRDGDGSMHLNNNYLLKVLTSAAASTADRPYWRRSASQPLADMGSTIGNDAGMNVLHEFQPGILQLVRNHQPKFVSKIAGMKQGAINGPVAPRIPNWKH